MYCEISHVEYVGTIIDTTDSQMKENHSSAAAGQKYVNRVSLLPLRMQPRLPLI